MIAVAACGVIAAHVVPGRFGRLDQIGHVAACEQVAVEQRGDDEIRAAAPDHGRLVRALGMAGELLNEERVRFGLRAVVKFDPQIVPAVLAKFGDRIALRRGVAIPLDGAVLAIDPQAGLAWRWQIADLDHVCQIRVRCRAVLSPGPDILPRAGGRRGADREADRRVFAHLHIELDARRRRRVRAGFRLRLDRIDQEPQPVMRITAKGGGRLIELRLVGARIGGDDRPLRIVRRQEVGDKDGGAGQAHAFRSRAGEVDEALRGDAMRLVERRLDAELAIIAGHDRWSLAEAGIEDRLHLALGADIGELRGHVGVVRAVSLLGQHGDAELADDLQTLLAHRGAEAVRAGDQRDLAVALGLHVLEDLAAGHPVGVRRLEDEGLDRVDDLDRACQRDERDLRVLGDRDDRHGGAGGRAADDGDDLVVLDQARGEGARLVRVAAIVIEEKLDLLTEHAAGGVDLVDQQFEGLGLGIAERGGRAGLGDRGADLDVGRGRASQAERQRECAAEKSELHCFLHVPVFGAEALFWFVAARLKIRAQSPSFPWA